MFVLIAILLIVLDLFDKPFFFASFFVLFSCGLMPIFSIVFGLLFLLCMYIYCRFLVWSSQYLHKIILVTGLLISNAFSISCVYTLLFLWLLVFILYENVDDFIPLLVVCLYWWALPFVIFLFLGVAFFLS